jgi:hypothetical protein
MIRFEPSGDERRMVDVVLVARVCQNAKVCSSQESAELSWFDCQTLPPQEIFCRLRESWWLTFRMENGNYFVNNSRW